MARNSKVKGPCFKESCHRRAKRSYRCSICESFEVKACDFHRERGFAAVQEHCLVEHPKEVRAARQAQERPSLVQFPPGFTLPASK